MIASPASRFAVRRDQILGMDKTIQPDAERVAPPPEAAEPATRPAAELEKEAEETRPAERTDKAERHRAAAARPEAGGPRGVRATEAEPGRRASRNNVRKLRTERMMSKAELARRAGVSTLTIDRVERGLPCRMDTKRKILEALGLQPTDRVAVFGDEED